MGKKPPVALPAVEPLYGVDRGDCEQTLKSGGYRNLRGDAGRRFRASKVRAAGRNGFVSSAQEGLATHHGSPESYFPLREGESG